MELKTAYSNSITVIQTLILPKLVHLFTTLPNPGDKILKQINDMLFQFVWQGPIGHVRSQLRHNFSSLYLLLPIHSTCLFALLIFKSDRSVKLFNSSRLFSSPDPKGHVSYCHHLASVVVVRRTS
jgi:hypothetical protein